MKKFLSYLFFFATVVFASLLTACNGGESLPPDLFFVKGNSYEFSFYDHSQLSTNEERINEIMLEMGFSSEEEFNGWVIEITEKYKDCAVDFRQDGTFVLFDKNSDGGALTGTYSQDKYVVSCSANGQNMTFRIWNGHVGLVLNEFYSDGGLLEFICFAMFD